MSEPTADPGGAEGRGVAASSGPLWRNQQQRLDRGRRRSIGAALALIGLLAVGLVYLFTWLDPIQRPVLLLVEATPNGITVPGWTGDRRALSDLASFTTITGRVEGAADLGPEFERRQGEIDGQTVVLYLAASVVVDRVEGQSRLLIPTPTTADRAGGATPGVTLDSILDALRVGGPGSPTGVPLRPLRPARLLLVLDLHPPPLGSGLPLLVDDLGSVVAREATRLVATTPDLKILTSSAAGQTAGASAALGRSAFGFYLEQGVRGAADASSDRRLSVTELANFVRDRVERWSRLCRGTAQTPKLFQALASADFPLVAVPTALPVVPALPKEAPAYPSWLLDAWRARDAGLQAGDDRLAPRPFGQLEATLLRAERDWIGGSGEAEVRPALRAQISDLQNRIKAVRAIPPLPPRSLALARAWGATDDPDLIRLTREWLSKRPQAAPDTKPGEVAAAEARSIAEFLGPLAGKPDFAVASAIVAVAASDLNPTHETITALDRVLAVRQPRPLYVETLALRRLAQLSNLGWRPERARLVLNLTLRTEAAQSNPMALSVAPTVLDDADRVRHEAMTLAALPGYVNSGDADRLLVAALAATDAALAQIEQVSQARKILDEAARLLPAAIPLLAGDEDLTRNWLAASQQVQTLVSEEVAHRLAEPGGGQVDRLNVDLDRFRGPAIHARVGRWTAPDAQLTAEDYPAIAHLMATALPLADGRAALWKARIDLDRSLLGAVLALDKQNGRKLAAPIPSSETSTTVIDPGADYAAEFQNQIRAVIIGPTESAVPTAGSAPNSWATRLARVPPDDLIRRDRFARFVPPSAAVPALDDPATDPARQRRAEEWGRLGAWLAARYQFEAFDPEPSEFFAAAALDYQRFQPRPAPRLALAVNLSRSRLTPEQPAAVASARFEVLGADQAEGKQAETAWVDLVWLSGGVIDVRPQAVRPPGAPEPTLVPLGARWPVEVAVNGGSVAAGIRLSPDPVSGPLPRGFVVRARWRGRTYHLPVALEVETAANRLQPFLTTASVADRPVNGVLLRPTQGKTRFILQVRNPSDHDRVVNVQLLDRRGPIADASVTQPIRAGESSRISFGPPAPDPEPGMVEIRGPLTVRVADAAHPEEVVNFEVPVRLVPPSALIQVVDASYTPGNGGKGGKSRLEIRVRAAGAIVGPAPMLELQLPMSRNPGLITPGEGTFRAPLPLDGTELVLFAEGLRFDPRGSEEGVVYLAVDGVERALVFQARFPRRGPGSPLIPDLKPALRLRGERVAAAGSLWPLTIEVDAPPPAGQINLKLGQYAASGFGDRFNVVQQFDLDADRSRFRLNPRGGDGALIFDASVRDPVVTLDLAGIRGERLVLAKLLNDQGQVEATDQMDLIIDDRAPAALRFVDSPKYGLRGGTITLRAEGAVPASGLKEAGFFVGRPGADGKRPAAVALVPARATDSGRTAWQGTVPLTDAKLGPLEISAEFVAGNGLSRFVTTSVAVVESIPAEPGILQGIVKEGARPQPKFEVRVLDEKGAEQRKVQTDDEGRFIVRGLPPGKYQVVSTKLTPPTKGSVAAQIQPDKITEVEVPMFRGR